MDQKKILLRPIALWLIVAGLLSVVTIILLTFSFKSIGTVLGLLLMLLIAFLAVYEIGAVRSLWVCQEGERGSILRSIGINIPFRLFFIVTLLSAIHPSMSASSRSLAEVLLVLNGITLAIEVLGFVIVYVKKSFFQPPQDIVDALMKRVNTIARLVTKCPQCQTIVETEWLCCPGCGSELPHVCPSCGQAVKQGDLNCSNCGAVLPKVVAVESMIKAMKDLSELPATPETRSVRYAIYAEALLKGGRLDEAIEAYRKAIQYTQYERKRTNFMVKMAKVYQNSGRTKEALEMLEAAKQLDPQDWADAEKKKELLSSAPSCEVKV